VAIKTSSDSSNIKAIRTLVNRLHNQSPLKDSAFELAEQYFVAQNNNQDEVNNLTNDLQRIQQKLKESPSSQQQKKLSDKLLSSERRLKLLQKDQDQHRVQRLHQLYKICDDTLELCLGESHEDTIKKTSRVLATLQLLSPPDSRQLLVSNQRRKPIYRAILSILLLEQLLKDKLITNKYILVHAKDKQENFERYKRLVLIPIMLAAMLMDIGQVHPDALLILKGEEGKKDEFRALEQQERIDLLKISYKQSLQYITQGLGQDAYTGNSKSERDLFNQQEKDKVLFIRTLLKSAIHPEKGVGNLLKIPQIYTSVVLSTKKGFSYGSLPKIFMLLDKGAEKGSHSQEVVDSLLKIMGIFPPGFGITYIPRDSDRRDMDRYEYAIVSHLYPEDPHAPICRAVTRTMTFFSAGNDYVITPANNLYYPKARKKLEKISETRLKEILSQLWDNFENRQETEELIPKCWHPYEYFTMPRYQNLWNNADRYQN